MKAGMRPTTGEPNVVVMDKGPLMVYGDLLIKDTDGQLIEKKKAVGFCRCGASSNKPFCDGSHKNIVF